MTTDSAPRDSGLHSSIESLQFTLQQYVEAQYHISDESLIRERQRLLNLTGTLWQSPFIESTPVYASGSSYDQLSLPSYAQTALQSIVDLGILPKTPYKHQADALEAFVANGQDLVIATGTGSGKTESFLMPMICHLVEETHRADTDPSQPGVRALLLYPMNALVNDQLGRIRKLIGDSRANRLISGKNRIRPVLFGSYTGRTPYPGNRSRLRDELSIKPLFEDFYLPAINDEHLRCQLDLLGRWPAKDLEAFYGKHLEEEKQTKTGKKFTRYNWPKRLKTQPSDRELFTRHEMIESAPDILITNYSMLEYMLMRPLEAPIFQQTTSWLQSDDRNQLMLILDEAHMYRGAGGAEVALLLRRLTERLRISRDRLRVIMTSASLGTSKSAISQAKQFCIDLTGKTKVGEERITIITGTPESRDITKATNNEHADAFAAFELTEFQKISEDFQPALAAVNAIAPRLGWLESGATDEVQLRNYLFNNLSGYELSERLLQSISGNAVALPALEENLFANLKDRRKALSSLLALTSAAKRTADSRVLVPARAHLFFRGLNGLHACTNTECDKRLDDGPGPFKLGRLYAQSKSACDCTKRGRVYELLTHRVCGGAFLRGFIDGPNGDYLWHEPSGWLREASVNPLNRVDVLVEREPCGEVKGYCQEIWIDIGTGRLLHDNPKNDKDFLHAYIPSEELQDGRTGELRFSQCPVCARRIRSELNGIMDHETKGEAPFANLVKTQLLAQQASRPENKRHPNGGRKVLLFSDGRQKAARLARDIPREVEQDIFRQALAVAAQTLISNGREARPTRDLYVAFLAVVARFNLPLFDREDAETLDRHVAAFEDFESDTDFSEVLQELDDQVPPERYVRALLKQLCGLYYSIRGTAVGFVEPRPQTAKKIQRLLKSKELILPEDTRNELSVTFVSALLDRFAFGPDIDHTVRRAAAGYRRSPWGFSGKLPSQLRKVIGRVYSLDDSQLETIEQILVESMCDKVSDEGYFLKPSTLRLNFDMQRSWFQCAKCNDLSPLSLQRHCSACGNDEVRELDPKESEYIRARKGFWRMPVEHALEKDASLKNISVEEHSAQLSNRDSTRAYATTELYELGFQDIELEKSSRPIDVLSCTTTMEVGVDIGSLVAVGLRNVPPERQNYQQRAGRAGRRGSSVSSVITYAQNGPHDAFYFHSPERIVTGEPRTPELKVDNPKIARRHVNSYLIQTFFHQALENSPSEKSASNALLQKALGSTADFYHQTGPAGFDLPTFRTWINDNFSDSGSSLCKRIGDWLPANLQTEGKPLNEWVQHTAFGFIDALEEMKTRIPDAPNEEQDLGVSTKDEEARAEKEELLEFLFFHGFLPTYAFPNDLTSFLIERKEASTRGRGQEVHIKERPQQAIHKALSEYAPGRLVVINKETYRSGGVCANVLPTVTDRAEPLFRSAQRVIHCNVCNFVLDPHSTSDHATDCPVCGSDLQLDARMIRPEVFTPEDGTAVREDDREQDLTYATMAQFPVPAGSDIGETEKFDPVGRNLKSSYSLDKLLVTLNKGQERDGSFTGFHICEKCGKAAIDEPASGNHRRPYLVSGRNVPYQCDGQYRNVYLGFSFRTDLLLLRIDVSSPINSKTSETKPLRMLEDALYTIAEALRMAASRHRQLDIDPSEFGTGFRIVPGDSDDSRQLDIYLYDMLAGGAGYAEIAHHNIEEILKDTLDILQSCPGQCENSCQECLRHYFNQHITTRLDRHLGADLLRYALDGTLPYISDVTKQIAGLSALSRLLSLDGFSCEFNQERHGVTIPMLARKDNTEVAVGTIPALYDESAVEHPLHDLNDSFDDTYVCILDEYLLARNLPDQHQKVRTIIQAG